MFSLQTVASIGFEPDYWLSKGPSPVSMCLYGNRVVSWWRSSRNQDEPVWLRTSTISAGKLDDAEREVRLDHVNEANVDHLMK